jgi:hypothetical protein
MLSGNYVNISPYEKISFKEAEQRTGFAIPLPDYVPDGYVLEGIYMYPRTESVDTATDVNLPPGPPFEAFQVIFTHDMGVLILRLEGGDTRGEELYASTGGDIPTDFDIQGNTVDVNGTTGVIESGLEKMSIIGAKMHSRLTWRLPCTSTKMPILTGLFLVVESNVLSTSELLEVAKSIQPYIPPTATPLPTIMPTARPSSTPTRERPTATPSAEDFELRTWSSTSPDGRWIAQTTAKFPTSSDTENYYTQLKVSQTNGNLEWVVVDGWEEWLMGHTIPQVLQWSRDGQHLYFTNQVVPGGCTVFVNGSDLQRLDLENGNVEELVPDVGLWLTLAPDEATLAYIGYGGRGLVIRDLATGNEREMKLDSDQDYQAGRIVWSPDGAALALTLAFRPCTTNWANATSIVYVEIGTLTHSTLLSEDQRLFITLEWITEDQLLLRDNDGLEWLMDVVTGTITEK